MMYSKGEISYLSFFAVKTYSGMKQTHANLISHLECFGEDHVMQRMKQAQL